VNLIHSIATHPSGVVKIIFSGKILTEDDFTAIHELIDKQLKLKKTSFMINLEGINYINSSGLNLLLRIFTKIRNKSGELVYINPSESVNALLNISKLNTI
jgi:anti-anti-sigma factor